MTDEYDILRELKQQYQEKRKLNALRNLQYNRTNRDIKFMTSKQIKDNLMNCSYCFDRDDTIIAALSMCIPCTIKVAENTGKMKINGNKIPELAKERKPNRENIPCQMCGREDQSHLWRIVCGICVKCKEKQAKHS